MLLRGAMRRGAPSTATALSHQKEPLEVVQTPDQIASPWRFSRHVQLGGEPSIDCGRLYISSGLRTPWSPPGRAGKCCRGGGRLRLAYPAATATQP